MSASGAREIRRSEERRAAADLRVEFELVSAFGALEIGRSEEKLGCG